MDYTVSIEDDVCVFEVAGVVMRPGDSIELQEAARKGSRESGCMRFLYDLRKATIRGGVIDAYEAGTAPVDAGFNPTDYRVALVYGSVGPDNQFMENVLVNRGFTVRIFSTGIAAARAWLLEA